ncbi:hypothetical protein GCM10027570_25000 [Streptomonospora sediminis]
MDEHHPPGSAAARYPAAWDHLPIETALSRLGTDLAALLTGYQPPDGVATAWVDDEDRLPSLLDITTAAAAGAAGPTCGTARVRARLLTYADRLRSITRVIRAIDAVTIAPEALAGLAQRHGGEPDRLHDEVEEHIGEQRHHAAEAAGYDTDLQACLSAGNAILDNRPGADGFPRFLVARSGLLDPRINAAADVLRLGQTLDLVVAAYTRTSRVRRHRALAVLLAAGYPPLRHPL